MVPSLPLVLKRPRIPAARLSSAAPARLARRLQSFVKNPKRFLGDIGHELCAPIARIQFALGILEQKAGPEQQRHVAALHEEIQEMSALVNELLSFSKAGMHAGSAPLTVVSLAGVAQKQSHVKPSPQEPSKSGWRPKSR